MSTPARKDVDIDIEGFPKLTCRPILAKLNEIEDRYGPAVPLINRLRSFSVKTAELQDLVAIMVRGVDDAPKPDAVKALVYEAGPFNFFNPVAAFLWNGITVDRPVKPEEDAGNATGGPESSPTAA